MDYYFIFVRHQKSPYFKEHLAGSISNAIEMTFLEDARKMALPI